MFTDLVGYTALTQRDEALAMQILEEHRRTVRLFFSRHDGREIKTIGDAFLVEFQSALDAVLCAVAIQQTMHDRKLATGETISIRIGIHVGDVVERGNDILGDAVNIASRIEPLAEPGGVCMTSQVYEQIGNKSELTFISMGEKSLKNVSMPVHVYTVRMPWKQPVKVEVPSFPTARIAILPFRNMSPDTNDEYFAEGITEEIISTVSGISGLKVISRTSVMQYKNTEKTVKEIGRELEVGSILEGSLRKSGNRIRVTTQLIDVTGDEHLWAQNYDRNLDDVFEVQSDVAKQVADALKVRILAPEKERIERKPTESTEAYALYLKGRYHWNKRGVVDVRKAIEYFNLAVHEDPGFALGYVGLCDSYSILASNWGRDSEANREQAKSMVSKAVELDPGLAEAHASKGLVLAADYKPRDAEYEYRKAIELKPNYASAHHWYYNLLCAEMRLEEALPQIEKAEELDPLSPTIKYVHGYYYEIIRDYNKAIEMYKKLIEQFPDYSIVHLSLAGIFGRLKMFDEARREADLWVGMQQGSPPSAKISVDAAAACDEGDIEAARRLLLELEGYLGQGVDAYEIAGDYFTIGDKEKGFMWLERAYSRKEWFINFMRNHPFLDEVRTDPRYLDLLKRLGLND
jgi:TolB-like protein